MQIHFYYSRWLKFLLNFSNLSFNQKLLQISFFIPLWQMKERPNICHNPWKFLKKASCTFTFCRSLLEFKFLQYFFWKYKPIIIDNTSIIFGFLKYLVFIFYLIQFANIWNSNLFCWTRSSSGLVSAHFGFLKSNNCSDFILLGLFQISFAVFLLITDKNDFKSRPNWW